MRLAGNGRAGSTFTLWLPVAPTDDAEGGVRPQAAVT